MPNPNRKRFSHWCAGAALAATLATPAHATLFAYEGFSGIGDGTLAGTGATGSGFTGGWDITNGGGGASTTQAAGLSYPGSYPGTNTAIGGNGRVTGATGDNAFLALDLDATARFNVNNAGTVYISWLAQNVAVSTTAYGVLDAGTRDTFNLAAEYPRNSGLRINSVGDGSNSALGMVGNSGNWNGSNQSLYGDGELNPEVVDTWGAFNFNDANNIFTGNGGTGDGPGSPSYNPAAANYDGVDHLLLTVDVGGGAYNLQVNPQIDGSNDGEISWVHTDGGPPIQFVLNAIGFEAGNDSSDRAPGDLVFDEIRIADTFVDAAGFVQIPEPSIALLGGLGLLGLLRRRRA